MTFIISWFRNLVRKAAKKLITVYNLRRIASYETIPYIRAFSNTQLSSQTYLGRYCSFNGIKIQGGGRCIIGDYFHSGENIRIITQNHNFNNGKEIPYDENYILKDVIIDNFVWIGSDVTILPGVRIGEGAIIQAGSVVVSDIPKYAIAGGHPAKPFAYRDKEHFEQLKKSKKFHFGI
ncbi:MAG: acyltransferase [Candidatus Hodarchaeota archaeon]